MLLIFFFCNFKHDGRTYRLCLFWCLNNTFLKAPLRVKGIRKAKAFTVVFPVNNMTGSSTFPVENANVQSAYADLSSHPVNSLWRPDEVLEIQSRPQYIQCFQLKLDAH